MTNNSLKAVGKMYVKEYSNDGTISVKFMTEVEIIKDYQFANCSNLVNVEFPTSLRVIGASSFLCTGIKKLVIPEGVEEIGREAFNSCANLEEVILPSTLKKIEEGAFFKTKIKKLVIPEGVEEIGYCTFYECSNLEEVTLPTTLKKIDNYAFTRTKIKKLITPEGVEEIGASAFYGCSNLEEVTFPTTLKRIGEKSFCQSGIKSIVIPDGVEEIGKQAFDVCYRLSEVTLPAILKKPYHVIFDINSLEKITLTSSLDYYNFCNACHLANENLSSLFFKEDFKNIDLSFVFTYTDFASLKKFLFNCKSHKAEKLPKNMVDILIDNLGKKLGQLISNTALISSIKEKFFRLDVFLIGPHLPFYQKSKLENYFSRVGIESCTFLTEENNATTSLILDNPNFNIEDDEILTRMKKIDALIANYPEKTKSIIINKRNEFIKEYKESMGKEKPVLDFSKDVNLSFGKMEIGFSKVQFLARLDNFIQILSDQTKFSSKLKDYYKILECPPKKMVEYPYTNEEILNNLVSLLSFLEESKKEEVIQKIKTILDEMRGYYEQGIEEKIALYHDSESILSLKLESLYNNTLDYYEYYKQAKPYISLKQSFESDSKEHVGAAEFLLFNFWQSLANIKQQEYVSALHTSFEEIKNKYTKIIDYVLENKEFQNDNYQKIVRQLLKDMEPLLIYMNTVISQEKKHDDLQLEIQEELKRLQNQETDISSNGALQSFVIDIERFVKEKQLTENDKEEIKLEIERVLNSYLDELNSSISQGEIQGIEFELYKEMARILLTIMTYERDKNRYNTHYLIHKNIIKKTMQLLHSTKKSKVKNFE